MMLLSGCTTTQIKPVTLPATANINKDTVVWLEENNAPDSVIFDFLDCADQGELINRQNGKNPVKVDNWDVGAILGGIWSGITSFW